MIPRLDKTTLTKQDVPKQRKKILLKSGGRMGEDLPATGCERGKNILEQDIGMKSSLKKKKKKK